MSRRVITLFATLGLALAVCFAALGCSRGSSGPEKPSRPQDLIIGRWESNDAGLEFTSSGTLLQLGQQIVVQYRFLDDSTIEGTVNGQSMLLTEVAVSQDSLSFTAKGKTVKCWRVKDFSASLKSKLAAPYGTPHPPAAAKTEQGLEEAQQPSVEKQPPAKSGPPSEEAPPKDPPKAVDPEVQRPTNAKGG